MLRLFCLVLVVGTILVLVGCSDDDPVESTSAPMVGVWIYDSSSIDGIMSTTPEDTLTFRSDYTGSYRSVVGWGQYDFSYSTRNDSIFRVRTAGQSEGASDTCQFDLSDSQLKMTFVDTASTRVRYLTLKTQ